MPNVRRYRIPLVMESYLAGRNPLRAPAGSWEITPMGNQVQGCALTGPQTATITRKSQRPECYCGYAKDKPIDQQRRGNFRAPG